MKARVSFLSTSSMRRPLFSMTDATIVLHQLNLPVHSTPWTQLKSSASPISKIRATHRQDCKIPFSFNNYSLHLYVIPTPLSSFISVKIKQRQQLRPLHPLSTELKIRVVQFATEGDVSPTPYRLISSSEYATSGNLVFIGTIAFGKPLSGAQP